MSNPHILYIDAYDSFSDNIITLLRSSLSATVESIKIDDARFVLNDEAFSKYLHGFDAVVAGPGPGHPENQSDVGLIGRLWDLPDQHLLPVLGICLGFQSLALAFGGKVGRLHEPRHGMVTPITHCESDMFNGTSEVFATQYHSLHVTLGTQQISTRPKDLWRPSKSSKELLPLAYDLSDQRNGSILMAARHGYKPFWGVQYHPESICTNFSGQNLILRWWRMALTWRVNNRRPKASIAGPVSGIPVQKNGIHKVVDGQSRPCVQWKSFQTSSNPDLVDIASVFRNENDQLEPILLESGLRDGKPVNSETGRYSVIGLPDPRSLHIKYSVASSRLTISTADDILAIRECTIQDAFVFLEQFMEEHKAVGGPVEVPFWGGLVGFVSYEAGLESIDVGSTRVAAEHPDVWFVFVERSIVVDHVAGAIFLQSVRDDDADWLLSAEGRLHFARPANPDVGSKQWKSNRQTRYSPQQDEYCEKVRTCQEHLRAGSSYELCLTDTTSIQSKSDPWPLYLQLRQLNPAPFGAYFNTTTSGSTSSLDEITLLSSSPERFLSWSRSGQCQFRPIKGTVKKSPSTTREDAENILNSPKERAENLMIVDLIRHDLSGVHGVQDVSVPKLMQVEEYTSVYQLVSVISGNLTGSGIPVLAASLPPGSMTGAPKKRSCELLHEIEGGKPRGLYSGVFGYLDVGGGGDFSVVIRSAFKWGGEDWRVGAGGAVTALSEPLAEWEEMLAKRENVLRAFG